MPAYNSLDGTPCTANAWLLDRLLKTEWGFKGFSISDACAVGGANSLHGTSPGYEESGALAISAGLDVIFQTEYEHHTLFLPPFLDGRILKSRIDDAVARVLRAKFELGLFEDPYVDPAEAGRIAGNPEHRALAREAARKSIVLLKNEGPVLPLREIGSRFSLSPAPMRPKPGSAATAGPAGGKRASSTGSRPLSVRARGSDISRPGENG